MFKPYFSLGFQERLFIVVPRVTEMQRCSDTRRLGARAEMRESLCERALGQCSLILTPTDSEFTGATGRGRLRTNYLIE